MASRYAVIVDNVHVVINGEPIYATGSSYAPKKFTTKRTGRDVTHIFHELLNDEVERQQTDPDFGAYIFPEPDMRTYIQSNDQMKLMSIHTPRYALFLKLIRAELEQRLSGEAMRPLTLTRTDGGVAEPIQRQWDRRKRVFFGEELIKYAVLMNLVEPMIRYLLERYRDNRGIPLLYNGRRVMSMLTIDKSPIVNPYSWFSDSLGKTKLFKSIYGDEELSYFGSFKDPLLFRAELKDGIPVVGVGTAYDILQMCGVTTKYSTLFTREQLLLLVAGYAAQHRNIRADNMYLPNSLPLYMRLRTNNDGSVTELQRARTREELDIDDDDIVNQSTSMQRFLENALWRKVSPIDIQTAVSDFSRGRIL